MYIFSFITFRSCRHLDNKHTIFGKVVGGMETLTEMEKIEVDNKDRPIEDIILMRTEIFVNPFDEADEQVHFLWQFTYKDSHASPAIKAAFFLLLQNIFNSDGTYVIHYKNVLFLYFCLL